MVVDLRELDASLQEALEPPYVGNKHAIVQALLEVKPRLLKLFDVGARNADEKKEVESGTVKLPDGKSLAVNQDFAQGVIFLSEQLECSEKYCAELLNRVSTREPNLDLLRRLELSVEEHHEKRQTILNILTRLLEALSAWRRAGAGVEFDLLARIAEQGLAFVQEGQAGQRLIDKLLKETVVAKRQADLVRGRLMNATSLTATGVTLGDQTLQGQLLRLLSERRQLAALVDLIAEARELRRAEILELFTAVSQAELKDEVTFYIFTALLNALSINNIPDDSPAHELFQDKQFIILGTARFDNGPAWKNSELRSALMLQWANFLYTARTVVPKICDESKATGEDIEKLAWNAMQGDAFTFLQRVVFLVRGQDAVVGDANTSTDASAIPLAEEGGDFISPLFRIRCLRKIEDVITSLIISHAPVLRKVKHRQEDVGGAGKPNTRAFAALAGTASLASVGNPAASSPAPRNDIAALFRLIGALYTALPPGSALHFWTAPRNHDVTATKLPAFIRWAAESRPGPLVPAAYEMFAGLSKGTACSEHAYNFLATAVTGTGSTFSWATLFGAIDYYANALPSPRNMVQQMQQPPQQQVVATMNTEEVLLLTAFLKLLRAVVFYSIPARLALAEHPQYRAVPSLLLLATCRIVLELKGAIYETISAFVSPGGGHQGAELCRNTWLMMEQLQLVNVRPTVVAQGVRNELMEVEMAAKEYPCSTAFIRLLTSLLRSPKDLSLKQVLFDVEPENTIPEGLGGGYRLPGIGPYTAFVVDDVLFLPDDVFKIESERWMIKELCLRYVEKALAGFRVEHAGAAVERIATLGPQVLIPWLTHPGFDITVRLLSESKLRALVDDFLRVGMDKVEQRTIKTKFFERCMLRVMRIVHRLLEIQSAFLEALVPSLATFDASPVIGVKFTPHALQPFDQYLLFNHVLVERIAVGVLLPSEDMQLLAVRILSILASSLHFNVMDMQVSRGARRLNRLAVIIQNSVESIRISDGFTNLLLTDGSDLDIAGDNMEVEGRVGAGAPDPDEGDAGISLAQTIRIEILELLLVNTQRGRPGPNIAHLLLGFDVTSASEMSLQDPHAAEGRRSCFHAIADMVNIGVPRLDIPRNTRRQTLQRTPMYARSPILAEKCYKLLHQLCKNELTTLPTARYLRTREDFFVRHLAALPIRTPVVEGSSAGQVVYADASRVVSSCAALTSFLRLRSWVLESVALELHMLAEEKQNQRAGQLLDVLFGGVNLDDDGPIDHLDEEFFGTSLTSSQSLMRVLEIFQSYDLDWEDGIAAPEDIQLFCYASLDYTSCLRVDDHGCEIIDQDALVEILTLKRRTLHEQGVINAAEVAAETKYLLESCVRENHRREIEHAKGMGFEAWRRVLNISLSRWFDRLPTESRESILFDILQEIPPVIRKPLLSVPTAAILSETIVMLITKLREDRQSGFQLAAANTLGGLPVDRLHALLKSLLASLLTVGMSEVVRGNLYVALINEFQLGKAHADESPTDEPVEEDDFFGPEPTLFGNSSAFSRGLVRYSGFEIGTIGIITGVADRLVPLVCRDAIDGSEVWKSAAFTLLDSLVRLSRLHRQHKILNVLARQGYLQNFVSGLKEADEDLQMVLKPDPESLNALYVHEAKMAFLIRVAQTRAGAEKLVTARLFSVLAQCEYIDSRPQADQAFVDHDSFLPPAVDRYHQLLHPTLQLVESVLVTVGAKNSDATKQALDFAMHHRETLRILIVESQLLSLSQLQELPLVVGICTYVVPRVPRADLLTRASGFGPLHEVLISLSAKTICRGRWSATVIPVNDAEMIEARVPGQSNLFQKKIQIATESLQRWLLVYLVAASDASSREFQPVLLPSAIPVRDGDSGHIRTAPSVLDAVFALQETMVDLDGVLQVVLVCANRLENWESIGLEEMEEFTHMNSDGLDRLDVPHRRLVAFQKTETARDVAVSESLNLLTSVEMLLLLIWRHIDHYSNPPVREERDAGTPVSSTPTKGAWGGFFSPWKSTTKRAASPSKNAWESPAGSHNQQQMWLAAQAFRRDIKGALRPVLSYLDDLQLPDDVPELDARPRTAYLKAFHRRIRDIIADPTEEGEPDDEMILFRD